MSNPTFIMLGWVEVELGLWQLMHACIHHTMHENGAPMCAQVIFVLPPVCPGTDAQVEICPPKLDAHPERCPGDNFQGQFENKILWLHLLGYFGWLGIEAKAPIQGANCVYMGDKSDIVRCWNFQKAIFKSSRNSLETYKDPIKTSLKHCVKFFWDLLKNSLKSPRNPWNHLHSSLKHETGLNLPRNFLETIFGKLNQNNYFYLFLTQEWSHVLCLNKTLVKTNSWLMSSSSYTMLVKTTW